MSMIENLISGMPGLGKGASAKRVDESFWKGIFDKVESAGMAGADVPLACANHGRQAQRETVTSVDGQPAGRSSGWTPDAGHAPDDAPLHATGRLAGQEQTACEPRTGMPVATVFPARVMGAGDDGEVVSRMKQTALSMQGSPDFEPSTVAQPVNASWVNMANGELKLYVRGAGLTTRQALEAAALSWPQLARHGDEQGVSEIVLNGRTIYTEGGDLPAFILTC